PQRPMHLGIDVHGHLTLARDVPGAVGTHHVCLLSIVIVPYYANHTSPARSGPTRSTYREKNSAGSSGHSRCSSSRMSSSMSCAIASSFSAVTLEQLMYTQVCVHGLITPILGQTVIFATMRPSE